MYLTIDGPEEIPEAEWRPGNFPPSNLELARQLVPGYQAPRVNKKEEHEAEERREKAKGKTGEAAEENDEGEGGEVLLVAKVSSQTGSRSAARRMERTYFACTTTASRWAILNTSSWSMASRAAALRCSRI